MFKNYAAQLTSFKLVNTYRKKCNFLTASVELHIKLKKVKDNERPSFSTDRKKTEKTLLRQSEAILSCGELLVNSYDLIRTFSLICLRPTDG